MKRSATANWKGSGKEGKGTVTADSGVLSATPISYKTRFEEVQGTSSEELIAAAHAGCFSMKLSFVLGEAGFTPDNIDTKCTITCVDASYMHTCVHSTQACEQRQVVGDVSV